MSCGVPLRRRVGRRKHPRNDRLRTLRKAVGSDAVRDAVQMRPFSHFWASWPFGISGYVDYENGVRPNPYTGHMFELRSVPYLVRRDQLEFAGLLRGRSQDASWSNSVCHLESG